MLVAREKKKTNIAEYILYMWQLEDILRGMGLDIQQVEKHIIRNFQVEEKVAVEMYEWYDNLIAMMRQEKVEVSGHLQILKNNVNELTELHFYLLHKVADLNYRQIVNSALANLIEFRRKSGAGDEISDVELALNALYGHLLLKLQQKEIHPQTVAAMQTFSRMIAYLAVKYKEMEEKE